MIISVCTAAFVLVGLRLWQSRIDQRRRSGVFIVDEGQERWLVDFVASVATGTVYPKLYYRYFYKVPHHTDRDLSRDYDLREITQPRGYCGVHPTLPSLWEMRLTSESWTRAKQDALAVLERPKGSFRSARRRAKKANVALGFEPTWEPVPEWLQKILNARHEVFLRYRGALEYGTYEIHTGRVEDLERYLTRDWSPLCSNGSKESSKSRRFPKRTYFANLAAR